MNKRLNFIRNVQKTLNKDDDNDSNNNKDNSNNDKKDNLVSMQWMGKRNVKKYEVEAFSLSRMSWMSIDISMWLQIEKIPIG